MEYRIVLTHKEALELSSRLKFGGTWYVKDVYDGSKRTRYDVDGIRVKEYKTPILGTIHRFTSQCTLDGIDGIWFESKWTEKIHRFEIEFEKSIPEEFLGRPNNKGWEILKIG